ncbi:hypothetical protein BDA99DRAFT_526292 [Phascolomyces articulosus]|uniref:Uncharacterized protein n=1 Tax=Phascolomyces articulosus TaxID=60185 RepID=A0AAD5P8P1_9FUNG|nr:hypothetical protein BDA99DRAFT_526292 [Phascolomyces articulosus]
MMDPGMFLALTSDHHISDHEHDHLMKHEDMDRRWHGCDWSTHESLDLLYFEPGITTAELLHVKGGDHGFICLTPEDDDDDMMDDQETEEDDNTSNDTDSYRSFEPLEKGISTHEPQLVILYKDGEPFVEEPKSILETKSLVVVGTGGKGEQPKTEDNQPKPQKQPSTPPRPQPQFSKKRRPNSGGKRRKRGTKF